MFIYVDDLKNKILPKHLSTPESQEADGEWITKLTKAIWFLMYDNIKNIDWNPLDWGIRNHKLIRQTILSNLPKTNDKMIDELIEKRRTYEPLDWDEKSEHHIQFARASIDLVKDEFIDDLTSLKSPTTTDESESE